MQNGLIVDRGGTQRWYLDDQLHRENDLPALIDTEGSQSWWRHGKMHRDNGPAIIFADGWQEWYRHGLLHRDNGPAVIWADGPQEWYQWPRRLLTSILIAVWVRMVVSEECQDGVRFPMLLVRNRTRSRLMLLAPILRRCISPRVSSTALFIHGTHHRNNGPAIIYKDGWQEWYRHGKEINVQKWIKDNDITSAWKTWDDLTWSLFRLEFL